MQFSPFNSAWQALRVAHFAQPIVGEIQLGARRGRIGIASAGRALASAIASLFLFMASAMSYAITNQQVFAYVEANYPNFFKGSVSGGQVQQFSYQYYAGSKNYLAVDTSGVIWVNGPDTGNKTIQIGPVSSFAGLISTWEATKASVPGSPVTRVDYPTTVMTGQVVTFSVISPTLPTGIKVSVEGCVADISEFPNTKINGVHSCIMTGWGAKAGIVSDAIGKVLYKFSVPVTVPDEFNRNNTLTFSFYDAPASLRDGKLELGRLSTYTFPTPTVTQLSVSDSYEEIGFAATSYPSSRGGKADSVAFLSSQGGKVSISFNYYRNKLTGASEIHGFKIWDDTGDSSFSGFNQLVLSDRTALNTSADPHADNAAYYNYGFYADPKSTDKCQIGQLFVGAKVPGPYYIARCGEMNLLVDAIGGQVVFGHTPLKYYDVRNTPKVAPADWATRNLSFTGSIFDGAPVGEVYVDGAFSMTPLTVEGISKAAADKATADQAVVDKAAADKAAADKATAEAAAADKAAAEAAAVAQYSCDLTNSGASYPACQTYYGQTAKSCYSPSKAIAACPTTNVLGKCTINTGSFKATTLWYKSDNYFPAGSITESDVKGACTGTWE